MLERLGRLPRVLAVADDPLQVQAETLPGS
jgi:hypothetical protein